MSAAILKITPKDDVQLQNGKNLQSQGSTRGFKTVRRPTRGITLRDETFATLRVVAGDGRNLHVIDAGSRLKKPGSNDPFTITLPDGREMRATDVYSNFLLQNVIEDRQEKSQILETFGEPYIFLFGERPRVIGFQGILLNSWDFNWEAEWWANYDNFLRGTKCVENDARVYLAFDNTIVGGYILTSNVQKTSQDRHWLQFQFNLFVTYYDTFSNLGNGQATKDPFYQTTELDSSYRQDLLRAGRPNLIDPSPTQSMTIDAQGNILGFTDQLGLNQSALAQPSSLASAWQKLQKATNLVLSTASQVWSGSVVRVPQGFEGSFAYDNADLAVDQEVKLREQQYEQTQVVQYSTFDRNLDEYVGESPQYGSSDLRFEYNGSDLPESVYDQGMGVASQADAFWRAAGLDPGPSISNTLASAVQTGRSILVGVNAAQQLLSVGDYRNQAVPDFAGSYYELRKSTDANPYPE